MSRTHRLLSLLAPSLLAACSGEPPPPPAPPPAPPPVSAPTPVASAPAPKKPTFENPGGMWMPEQLPRHAEKLKELGLEIDPKLLTDPTSSVLGSIVFLGGCSASFVSPEGLIVTNHHCVQGALQYSSKPEENLIEKGYLAGTRADEKWNGPAARVYVTQAVKEVTDQVLAGISDIKDDHARFKKIEARQKELVAACEKGRPEIRCNVARFFEGAQFYQIEQLELRDIRLVYAPHRGIGNFGGEIDNWRWPRHTGDFSFYRAYVGKDGKPADHAADNVPYVPKHHLKLASKPLKEGDLVFVAGYPARTYRWKTAAEVKEAVDWSYPRRLAFCEEYIKAMEAISSDKDVAIATAPFTRGLNNALTNTKGQLEGLQKGGLAAEKSKLEDQLRAFVDADPKRKAAHGDVLPAMAKLFAESEKTREKDASLREVTDLPKLLSAAMTIVRMADERKKPDAERHPDYQERNWKRLEQSLVALSKQYHRTMDRTVLSLALHRAAKRPAADQTEALKILVPKGDEKAIEKTVDALYAKTKLEDEAARVKLFQKATSAELKGSADPLIKAAVALYPLVKAMEQRDETLSGALAVIRPKYLAVLREFHGGDLAPDANRTLRITYGTVRGYRPTQDVPMYRPFTTLTEVVGKSTGKDPFDTPERLLSAAKAKKLGPYVDSDVGDVPVNFLADLHISGGNSGSATLNARGELTGLVFDGNYEAMASDWLFMPPITRSIHVDSRYMLWVMDAVDHADHLLVEMGVKPTID
jgi:hypothetical protein